MEKNYLMVLCNSSNSSLFSLLKLAFEAFAGKIKIKDFCVISTVKNLLPHVDFTMLRVALIFLYLNSMNPKIFFP